MVDNEASERDRGRDDRAARRTTDSADANADAPRLADIPESWAGISSYADTDGFIADDLRAERFRRRNLLRETNTGEANEIRVNWHWKDLFRTANDTRATAVLAVGVVAIAVGVAAFAMGIGAKSAADGFREDADSRIAELETALEVARQDLTDAKADADSVAPAVALSHFTVGVTGSGDDATITRIGMWEVDAAEDGTGAGTMQALVDLLGDPDKSAAVKGDAATCRVVWKEHGITATFEVDPTIPVGVFDPAACQHPDATRPVSVQLTGPAWQTDRGIGIGDSVEDLSERYPDAEKRSSRFTLASSYSYAESKAIPVLTAAIDDEERVTALLANFAY